MKTLKTLVLALLLCSSHAAFAQFGKDTVVTYYDYDWKPVKKDKALYIGVSWPQAGKFRRQDYYLLNSAIQMDGTFADNKCTIKDGVFTWFNRHGIMTDSCLYVSDKKQGTEIEWDDDGYMSAIMHWHKGLPVDTAFGMRKDGKLRSLQITDSMGNGLYRQMQDDGKAIQIEGRLLGGKRTGKWIFRDSKGVVGTEAMYLGDSIKTIKCFDENGQQVTTGGDCILEQAAGFKGGVEAWKRFLENNLRYPEEAQEHDIEGIVRVQFIINKDGSVDELKVLDSPHESLSKEALRIIQRSGKWVPARQYNRPVIYRHIQSISFWLE